MIDKPAVAWFFGFAHVGERAIHLTMCLSAAAQLAQRLWVEQNARLRLLSC